MNVETVERTIGDAVTPREAIDARANVCQYRINEAYFRHTMTLSECAHFREQLMGVSVLCMMGDVERAADILGDTEYALDAACPLVETQWADDYADTVGRYGALAFAS